jgi:hypothetical protein
MWLFPLPALLASAGFVFILFARAHFMREIRYAVVILVAGSVVFLLRAWRRKEWPFADSQLTAHNSQLVDGPDGGR